MDYRQYRRARRLVHECCNYIDGNCIALDDGEECVCVQSISYSLLCRWFRAAVLPQDKELETALFHRLNAKKCAVCEALFTPGSNRAKSVSYTHLVLRKKSVFSFSIKIFSPTRQMMAEILKIGVPTLVFQLLTSLSIALINRASSNYGDSVIAGMGAVTRVTSMGTLVVFGFLKGFQPIAGFSYGAKKFDRLREAIKTSIIWSTSFCLVVGLVMAVFSTQIISQFTEGDTKMILVGQK